MSSSTPWRGFFGEQCLLCVPDAAAEWTRTAINTYCKRGLGAVKIGRYISPSCEEPYEEERSFWEKLKSESSDVLNAIYQRMMAPHLSYQGISSIMEFIFPRGKDTIFNAFADSVEIVEIPPVKEVRIVHYYSTSLKTHAKLGKG